MIFPDRQAMTANMGMLCMAKPEYSDSYCNLPCVGNASEACCGASYGSVYTLSKCCEGMVWIVDVRFAVG